jgi:hypothetical protein
MPRPGLFLQPQQLRKHCEVDPAAAPTRVQCSSRYDHVAARRELHLALAGEQHVPGFVLMAADQGVLAVEAERSVGSRLASGTRERVIAAGSAVFGPSGRLEVPAAEGPQPFLLRSAMLGGAEFLTQRANCWSTAWLA